MTLLGRIYGTKFKVGDLVRYIDQEQHYAYRALAEREDELWVYRRGINYNPGDMIGIVVENDLSAMKADAHLFHSQEILVVLFGERPLFCASKALVRVKREQSK